MGERWVVLARISRYNAGALNHAGSHEAPMSQDSSPLMEDDFLVALRRDLLKFARLQLRNDALAEDMVQEALAAALVGERSFAGRAALKTWIFAILRNKIVDHFRASGRVTNVSALSPEEAGLDQAFEALFKANEHWARDARPAPWGDPEEALIQQRFWVVFDASCLTFSGGSFFKSCTVNIILLLFRQYPISLVGCLVPIYLFLDHRRFRYCC